MVFQFEMKLFSDWNIFLRRTYSVVQVNNNNNNNNQRLQHLFDEEEGINNEAFADKVHKSTTIVINQNNKRRFGAGCDRNNLRRVRNRYFTIALLGLVSLFGGLFILIANPYDFLFKWKIALSDGGEIFEMWRKPPVDLYLRVYLFNVTNKEEFLSGKEKLKVQEVGPYVYKELMKHENVTFNDNGTLSAVPVHPLVWQPELSVGDHETDQLILPHIALLSIADVVSESSYFTKLGLNLLIRQTKTQPLVQMSPKEFMFGYSSTLMSLGNKFLPHWISFEKLGLIDRMYDFDGDYETVFTGEDDITKSGLLDTYRGSTQMPQWNGPCGHVRDASDGTKFKSHVTENDTQHFFRKSMCRPQTLVMQNKTITSGLEGYIYKFPPNAMDNGVVDHENKCFCRTDKCLPQGLLDVRQCYYGFPIALSYPHFLEAEPLATKDLEGCHPNRREHESYFVIQPKSGLPLDVAVRFQINMALRKIGTIANVARFENMILPLLWTEIRMYSLPVSLAERFQLYLNILPAVTSSSMIVLLVSGVILLSVSAYKLAKRPSRKQRRRKVHKRKHRGASVDWLDDHSEDEEDLDDDDNYDNNEKRRMKILTYNKSYTPEKQENMTSKELEIYYNSLVVTPLNLQDNHHHQEEEDYKRYNDYYNGDNQNDDDHEDRSDHHQYDNEAVRL